MELQQISEAIDKLGTSHKNYRDTNDARLKALEKGDTSRADELDQKLAKLDKDLNDFDEVKRGIETAHKVDRERIETLEAMTTGPERTKIMVLRDEHSELFEKALRGQFGSPELNQKLRNMEASLLEAKDVTIGTAAAGGFAVPEEISREIEKLERKLSPVRDDVKVVMVGTSDYKQLVSIGGTASGWIGETGTRSATATSLLRERAPTHGELYAYPQVSEWSLDDIFFNVAAWLTDEVAEEFAIQEAQAVVDGNGTSKPTGMLDGTQVTTADANSPLRDADVFQYVASAASPEAVLPDPLITLVYTLNARYRAMAKWIMNSLTTAAVRKLKDGNSDYLWQPGLQAGEPPSLLGYAHSTWEQMPDVAAGAFPIGFGNWQRAYHLTQISGMRITIDQVTNPGHIRYYIRRREGGGVLNNDAAKFLETT